MRASQACAVPQEVAARTHRAGCRVARREHRVAEEPHIAQLARPIAIAIGAGRAVVGERAALVVESLPGSTGAAVLMVTLIFRLLMVTLIFRHAASVRAR